MKFVWVGAFVLVLGTVLIAGVLRLASGGALSKNTINAGITNAARTFDNASRLAAQAGPMIDRISRSADAVVKMRDEVAGASAGNTANSIGATSSASLQKRGRNWNGYSANSAPFRHPCGA